MTTPLYSFAKRIRHLPVLASHKHIWNALRRPYHRFMNLAGGVSLTVASGLNIRIPAEYSCGEWETYEPETVALVASWARAHDGGLFLDIGCSTGFFAAIVLFANPLVEVVAFDSDLASLVATRRFCGLANCALRIVYGFVTNSGLDTMLLEAEDKTRIALERERPSGDPGTTRYVCLSSRAQSEIPHLTLDGLFGGAEAGRSTLIKCDVEGAELLVLEGASDLLRKCRPTLCLSVHPPALTESGSSKEEVSTFLMAAGYEAEVFAIDHEEHWWCTPVGNAKQ